MCTLGTQKLVSGNIAGKSITLPYRNLLETQGGPEVGAGKYSAAEDFFNVLNEVCITSEQFEAELQAIKNNIGRANGGRSRRSGRSKKGRNRDGWNGGHGLDDGVGPKT